MCTRLNIPVPKTIAEVYPCSGGGADGSLMNFRDIETKFHPNIGLDEVVASFLPFQQRSNMTAADL